MIPLGTWDTSMTPWGNCLIPLITFSFIMQVCEQSKTFLVLAPSYWMVVAHMTNSIWVLPFIFCVWGIWDSGLNSDEEASHWSEKKQRKQCLLDTASMRVSRVNSIIREAIFIISHLKSTFNVVYKFSSIWPFIIKWTFHNLSPFLFFFVETRLTPNI